ncbi:MAG: TPM domain-containing protein [Erysipelotrichaceae bacterium]|nr:TPM domain-containing protein [Erysipelotrichaceae bacterium]
MKRLIKLSAILAVMIMMCMPLGVLAKQSLVIDEYGALTAEELNACEQKLQEVSDRYDVDVIALIANDTDGKDLIDFADDYYDAHGFGRGSDRSGIMLVIDMGGREMYMTTSGKCIEYFTDYGLECIADEVVDLMGDDFSKAIIKYGDLCDYYMNRAINDKPVDIYYNRLYIHLTSEDGKRLNGHFDVYDNNGNYIAMIFVDNGEGYTDVMSEDTNAVYTIRCEGISDKYRKPDDLTVRGSAEYDIYMVAEKLPYNLLTGGAVSGSTGLLAALIGTGIMKGKNKSVRRKYEADSYVERGSFNLHNFHDHYLYSRTSRTARPHESSSHSSSSGGGHGGSFSGGSSTHTSSSGATHGGGGRRGF